MLFCQFGLDSPAIRATQSSASHVTCDVPAQGIGRIEVLIKFVDDEVIFFTTDFIFVDGPRVADLNPRHGHLLGKTVINVVGSGFSNALVSNCKFGDLVSSNISIVSSTLIKCLSPPSSKVDLVTFSLSSEHVYVPTAFVFEFVQTAAVAFLQPSTGPSDGGQLVTVIGENFTIAGSAGWDPLIFGSKAATGIRVVSSTSIVCMTPANKVGAVVVWMTGPDRNARYEYGSHLLDMNIGKVLSTWPSIGYSTGGLVINLLGSNFFSVKSALCVFGTVTVQAKVQSDHRAQCITPAHASGMVSVVLGEVSGREETLASFVFHDPIQLLGLLPSMGPLDGGTLVTVRGENFAKSSVCRFGDRSVNAQVLSSSHLLCVSAPQSKHATFHLDVTSNSVEYSGSLDYQYVMPALLHRIFPTQGNADKAAIITLVGENFVESDWLSIKFGRDMVQRNIVWMSSSKISCAVPRDSTQRNVSVSVSNDGQNFAQTSIQYFKDSSLALLQAMPSAGPIMGHTVVSLSLAASASIDQDRVLACRFGDHELQQATRFGGNVLCQTPKYSEGLANISVVGWDDESEVFGTSVFVFHNTAALVSVHPSLVAAKHKAVITVVGDRFPLGLKFNCSFAGNEVPASFNSFSTIACESPVMEVGVHTLSVMTSAVRMSQNDLEFQATNSPIIDDMSPKVVFTNTHAITLIGQNFADSSASTSCIFDAVTTMPVRVLTHSRVQCRLPFLSAGVHSLMLKDSAMVSNSIDFFASAGQIIRVVPSVGHARGGQSITIFGANLMGDLLTECEFGVARTSASVEQLHRLSRSIATCRTPRSKIGQATFSLLQTTPVPSVVPLIFEFVSDSAYLMMSIRPNSGPTVGATVLTIVASHVPEGPLSCLFGERHVDATLLSSSMVKCSAPSQQMASVVLVSLFSENNFVIGSQKFEYWSPIHVRYVEPRIIKTARASTVTVIGDNFLNSDSMMCRFGARESSSAVFISSTILGCPLGALLPGNHTLDISVNGQDFVYSGFCIHVLGEHAPALSPSAGPVSGGQILEVMSSHFLTGLPLSAKFNRTWTVCSIISNGVGRCKTPPHAPGIINVQFRFGLDEDLSTEAMYVFQMLSTCALDRIVPESITSDGGLIVTAIGRNFDASAHCECMFGSMLSDAQVLSSSVVECEAPPHLAGTVPFELSVNGESTSSGIIFEYKEIPTISSIHAHGSGNGAMMLTIAGSHFSTTAPMSCRLSGTKIARSAAISSSLLACPTPAEHTGYLTVEVSNDGVQFHGSTAVHINRSSAVWNDTPLSQEIHPGEVSVVLPSMGPIKGGTLLEVRGLHFAVTREVTCRLMNKTSAAETVSSTMLRCGTGAITAE